MKAFQLIVILIFSGIYAHGQETSQDQFNTLISSLTGSASKMVKAISEEDYDEYVKYVHPAVIRIYDNEEQYVESLKRQKMELKNSGKSLVLAELQTTAYDLIGENGTYQTIVPFNYLIEIDGIRFKGIHYLFGITSQEEIRWTFVELENMDQISVKKLIPEFNDLLQFPDIKEPAILKE